MPSSKKPSRRSLTTLSPLKLLLLLFLLFSPALSASSNVPIDDPVYRDIDKLVGAGLVKDVIYGQRPWSRREIARLIKTAKANEKEMLLLSPNSGEVELNLMVQDILERLTREYQDELTGNGALEGEAKAFSVKTLEQIRLDYTLLDSPARLVPPNNGLGSIDAVINPMVSYEEGRHIVDGNTLGLETTHRARVGDYFSLYSRPRFELTGPRDSETKAGIYAQQLYGNFTYKKLNLEMGRDSLIWGQGEHGGLLLTNNARGLDMIKVSNDMPFFFPGFLKYLGPTKATLFVANLGPEREFPYSYLTGFKMSVKPTSFLELGASQLVIMGGDGAQTGSFWDYLGEFFAVRPNVGFNTGDVGADGGVNLSDRLMGADIRFFIPALDNSQIYYEMFTEACCGVFSKLYGYYGGFYAPLFLSSDLSLRLEIARFPAIFYRHGIFTSGKTLNGNLLGHHSGPDSNAFDLKIGQSFSEHWRGNTSLSYLVSKGHTYSNSTGTAEGFYVSQASASEKRYKIVNDLIHDNGRYSIQNALGFEYVENFNFEPNKRAYNFILRMVFTVKLP